MPVQLQATALELSRVNAAVSSTVLYSTVLSAALRVLKRQRREHAHRRDSREKHLPMGAHRSPARPACGKRPPLIEVSTNITRPVARGPTHARWLQPRTLCVWVRARRESERGSSAHVVTFAQRMSPVAVVVVARFGGCCRPMCVLCTCQLFSALSPADALSLLISCSSIAESPCLCSVDLF